MSAKRAGKSRDQINRESQNGRLLPISLGSRGQRIHGQQLDSVCPCFVHQIMERAQRIDSWVLYRALFESRDDLEGRASVVILTVGNLSDMAALVFAQLGLAWIDSANRSSKTLDASLLCSR